MPLAKTASTIVMAEFPDGQKAVYVEIAIDCPLCGQHIVRFAGHHMRQLRDIAMEAMDRYPELTGAPPEQVIIDEFTMRGGGDPTEN